MRVPFGKRNLKFFSSLTTADEMSVLTENPKIFFCSSHSLRTHLLLGSRGGRKNLRVNAKKEQKNKPPHRKNPVRRLLGIEKFTFMHDFVFTHFYPSYVCLRFEWYNYNELLYFHTLRPRNGHIRVL